MCGIAGYIGTRQVSDQAVERCLQLMERRGPDAHGYRRFVAAGRQVLLVHTRLSIIDLDPRSNQPFNSGRLWTAFNGELYNYVEIGARLRKDGVQLRTQSDTEVLLAAIDRYGWEILDQAEGMWALAVFDEADGSLTLSRDRKSVV